MSEPFIGEIKMFGGNFAPRSYMLCQGQQLAISQNDVLFALIGTTYGGDGVVTFNLPDLRGRVPIHQGTLAGGSTYSLGQAAGTESVTLTTLQMPAHTHVVGGNSGNGTTSDPKNNYFAAQPSYNQYVPPAGNDTLIPTAVSPAGNSLPHENRQPYLALNFIIATEGVFPSQN